MTNPIPAEFQAASSIFNNLFGSAVSTLRRGEMKLEFTPENEDPAKSLPGFELVGVDAPVTGEIRLTFTKLRKAEFTPNLPHAISEIGGRLERARAKSQVKSEIKKVEQQAGKLERHPHTGHLADVKNQAAVDHLNLRYQAAIKRKDDIKVKQKRLRLYLPVDIRWQAQQYKCYAKDEWDDVQAIKDEDLRREAKKALPYVRRWVFLKIDCAYGERTLNEFNEHGILNLKFFVGNTPKAAGGSGRVIVVTWDWTGHGIKDMSKTFARNGKLNIFPTMELDSFVVVGDGSSTKQIKELGAPVPASQGDRGLKYGFPPDDAGEEAGTQLPVHRPSPPGPGKRPKVTGTRPSHARTLRGVDSDTPKQRTSGGSEKRSRRRGDDGTGD